MDTEKRLVPIPEYARFGKNNTIYARKKDMPYFQDEPEIRGYYVIGHQTEHNNLMIPDSYYDLYCSEDATERKEKEKKEKKEREEAEKIREEEEAAELHRNLGWTYLPRKSVWEDMNCYPVNGFLAEKFFRESGLSEILNAVLGPERSFWIRLFSALEATYSHETFEFSLLNTYPMKDHMVFSIERSFAMSMLSMVTEDETSRILSAWIKRNKPTEISALACNSTITLYHDQFSDGYSNWMFIQRLRSGTLYNEPFLFYRDEKNGRLLAFEHQKASFDYHRGDLDEIYTIRNSTYPELRDASLHFYLDPYNYRKKYAVKQIPCSFCIHTTQYPDQKEMKKYLRQLETAQEENNRKIIRWDGDFEDVSGHWILMENPEQRQWMTDNARELLRRQKSVLKEMSFYAALDNTFSDYYEINPLNEDFDFFDESPFTVNNVKGAAVLFRQDAGRCLYFTTEESIPAAALIQRQWREESLNYMVNAFINQGETTELTDEFFNAMDGRNLTIFLAELYREWIYEHIGNTFTEDFDIEPFSKLASKWECEIDPDDTVHSEPFDKQLEPLLDAFSVTRTEIQEYMKENVKSTKYFSDEYR